MFAAYLHEYTFHSDKTAAYHTHPVSFLKVELRGVELGYLLLFVA